MEFSSSDNKLRLIDDEWGGIDEHILSVVQVLNNLGVITDGSCEGHIDKASPVPFVSVFQFDEQGNYLEIETKLMLGKVEALLQDFYSHHEPSSLVRITTEHPAFIHNGQTFWDTWRAEVASRVEVQKKGGVPVRPTISMEEKIKREKTLPLLQVEFSKFAKFLNEKRMSIDGVVTM